MILEKIKNKKLSTWLLVLISGLLLWLGWPVKPLPFLLFIAFVPLLMVEDDLQKNKIKKSKRKYFAYVFSAFVIWNTSTTWWVWNSTDVGAVAMILANSFLMSIPMILFHWTRKNGGDVFGYIGLICYWLGFEYIHLNWDLSWPWLTLGNGFAMFPQWIQWYEYTGHLGGTLWILLINIGFFMAVYRSYNKSIARRVLIFTIILVLVPVISSYYIYWKYENKGEDVEVVVLQPNIDPYTEKFVGTENFIPYEQQVERFIKLSKQKLTPETDYLLWPETAIDYVFNEGFLDQYPILDTIVEVKNQYDDLSLLTGITSYSTYSDKAETTPTARYREDIGYYDVYNTALFIGDQNLKIAYHKSKLVPGVEIMPYPKVFRFLTDIVFNLGGTAGSLGRQTERTVFYDKDSTGVAPAICYESVYGEYMAEFIRNGAELIFIITNDGWWGDSPGHRQHFHYAKLRAIETRRSIARSANTGISGYYNQRGDVLQATDYWEKDVIKETILANDELTFYVQYGDYIARTASWLAVFIFLGSFVKRKVKK